MLVNNNKVKEIIKFSLYKNIQNKWFIVFNIMTLIGIVLIVNWGNLTSLLKLKDREKVLSIAMVDESNLIYESFANDMSGDSRYVINRIENNDYTADTIPDDFVVIEVQKDEEEAFGVSIISKEGISIDYYNPIKDSLFKIRNTLLAKKYHVSNDSLEILQRDLTVNRIMLSVEADDSNTKEIIKLLSSALTYIITVFIFSKMANEIASEKQSKSTEYVLTTVSAKEYLFAKIFSNIAWLTLQGLFILAYYFIAALVLNVTKSIDMDFSLTASMVSSSISSDIVYYILALIVYNVLNLILLCIIQATLAAKTSSTAEAGNSMSLLLLIMMIAYFSTIYFLSPYEKVSVLLYVISCIPLLSAYFVPGMMVIGQANVIQILISLIVLIVAIPLTFNYCSKIFKNGILDYTKVRRKDKNVKSKEEKRKEFLNKREMKNFGFVIGVAIIIYVGAQTLLSLVGNLTLSTLLGNVLSETEITMILQILLQIVSLGLATIFVSSYTSKKVANNVFDTEENRSINVLGIARHKMSLKGKVKLVLVALFLVFSLQLILSLLLYPLLGLDYDTTDLFHVNASSSLLSKIVLVIALAVTPAIFEELFFRKTMISFSNRYGDTFALLFSALLFGMLHMNLSQGLFAFVMGLLFGAIYLYSGDIKLTMIIHFLNNGFAALELVLPEIGVMSAVATLLIFLTIGFVLLIKMIINKETREKIITIFKIKVNMNSFREKYKYIFADYSFDVSLILIFFMSIITEKVLR